MIDTSLKNSIEAVKVFSKEINHMINVERYTFYQVPEMPFLHNLNVLTTCGKPIYLTPAGCPSHFFDKSNEEM